MKFSRELIRIMARMCRGEQGSVALSGTTLRAWSGGQEPILWVMPHGAEDMGLGAVDPEWIARLTKVAGKSVEFTRDGAAMRAASGKTVYRTAVRGEPASPAMPAEESAGELEAALFARGGEVVTAIRYLGWMYDFVWLGDVIGATDGHKARRVAGTPGTMRLRVAIPKAVAKLLCSLVTHTAATRLWAWRGESTASISGEGDGVSWRVTFSTMGDRAHMFASMQVSSVKERTCVALDASGVLSLVAPFRSKDTYVAIYPCGGVVAWDKDEGASDWLTESPRGLPWVVTWNVIKPMLDVARGKSVAFVSGDKMDPALLAGQIVMPARTEPPAAVMERLFAPSLAS